MIEGPWDDGSPLDKVAHKRLIGSTSFYAEMAGIEELWLWQPLAGSVAPNEVKWVYNYHMLRNKRVCGLLYLGDYELDGDDTPLSVGERMQAMTGALVRNFIDARCRSLAEAVEEEPNCDCLMIHDLALHEKVPFKLKDPGARMIMNRARRGLKTVLYGHSIELIKDEFGESLANHLNSKRYPKVNL